MFEKLKKVWEERGEEVRLDEQSEMLTRDMIHSDKGSSERKAAVDLYMAFVRTNLDYMAKKRGWKKRGEEEDLTNIEELQKLYTDSERPK